LSILRGLQKLVDLVEGAQQPHTKGDVGTGESSSPTVPVLIDPLLEVDRSLYSGMAFVVVLRGGTCGGGSVAGGMPEAGRDGAKSLNGAIACTGGRYDTLIEHFAQLHALGLGLGRRPNGSGPSSPSSARVRICGVSAELKVDRAAQCMLLAEEATQAWGHAGDARRRGPEQRSTGKERFHSNASSGSPSKRKSAAAHPPAANGGGKNSAGGEALATSAWAAAPGWPQVIICHLPSDRYCSDYDEPNGRSLALEVVALAGSLRWLGVRCETRLVQEPSPDRLLRQCRGLPGCQFLVVLKRQPDDAVKYKVQHLGQAACEKAREAKEFTDRSSVCEFFAHLKAKNRLLTSGVAPSALAQPKDFVT